jgi:hypothetical protein
MLFGKEAIGAAADDFVNRLERPVGLRRSVRRGRRGRKVQKVESRTKLDTVAGANWIKTVIDADKPDRVFIDLGGVGAGTYDLLRDWGYGEVVRGVNFGDRPQEEVRSLPDGGKQPGSKNRRAEMWARSKEWLNDPGGADIPDLDSLHADACGPGYGYDTNQRLRLDSKDQMRARGIRSPDELDAICLTFAEPVVESSRRYRRIVSLPRSGGPLSESSGGNSAGLGWLGH